MTTLAHKMRSAAFYLRRPSFWSHFAHRAAGYVQPNLDNARAVAAGTQWARARAQTLGYALNRMGLLAAPDQPVPAMPDEALQKAGERVAAAPCTMGGGGDVGLIYAVARLSRAHDVVETGVAFGWSSLALLTALDRNGDGTLVSVDRPYPGDGSESFVGIAVDPPLKKRWRLIREPDRNGLRRAVAVFDRGVDVAHYDSDKTYRGRRFGYGVIWRALKPGGIFISDDIQDNMAFAHFVARTKARFGVVQAGDKFVGLAAKPV